MPKRGEAGAKGAKNGKAPEKLSKAEKLQQAREFERKKREKKADAKRKILGTKWLKFLTDVENYARVVNETPDSVGIFSVKSERTLDKQQISKKCASWDYNIRTKISLIQAGFTAKWPFMNMPQSDMATKYVVDSYLPPQLRVLNHVWPKQSDMSPLNALRRYERVADILQSAWVKTLRFGTKISWGKAAPVLFTGEPPEFFEKNTPMVILCKVDTDELESLIEGYKDDTRGWRYIRESLKPACTDALKKVVKRIRAKFKKVKENKDKMEIWEVEALTALDAFKSIFSRYMTMQKLV